MGNAGVEVVEKTLHERGELTLVDLNEIVAQDDARDRGAGARLL